MKKKAYKIETYELGNIKILIEPAKVRVKNAYIEFSFSIGTTIYHVYTDFVNKAKSGDEVSKGVLKTVSDLLLSINMYHTDIDFINHQSKFFSEKLGVKTEDNSVCTTEVK